MTKWLPRLAGVTGQALLVGSAGLLPLFGRTRSRGDLAGPELAILCGSVLGGTALHCGLSLVARSHRLAQRTSLVALFAPLLAVGVTLSCCPALVRSAEPLSTMTLPLQALVAAEAWGRLWDQTVTATMATAGMLLGACIAAPWSPRGAPSPPGPDPLTPRSRFWFLFSTEVLILLAAILDFLWRPPQLYLVAPLVLGATIVSSWRTILWRANAAALARTVALAPAGVLLGAAAPGMKAYALIWRVLAVEAADSWQKEQLVGRLIAAVTAASAAACLLTLAALLPLLVIARRGFAPGLFRETATEVAASLGAATLVIALGLGLAALRLDPYLLGPETLVREAGVTPPPATHSCGWPREDPNFVAISANGSPRLLSLPTRPSHLADVRAIPSSLGTATERRLYDPECDPSFPAPASLLIADAGMDLAGFTSALSRTEPEAAGRHWALVVGERRALGPRLRWRLGVLPLRVVTSATQTLEAEADGVNACRLLALVAEGGALQLASLGVGSLRVTGTRERIPDFQLHGSSEDVEIDCNGYPLELVIAAPGSLRLADLDSLLGRVPRALPYRSECLLLTLIPDVVGVRRALAKRRSGAPAQ